MADPSYEAPAIAEIGTLHELTLAFKDSTGVDGDVFVPPSGPPIPLGPVS
jgi:hypothetical protein